MKREREGGREGSKNKTQSVFLSYQPVWYE